MMIVLGVTFGSDALVSQRTHAPFHIWHHGYIVTDSPRFGLALGILLVLFGAFIVALFVLARETRKASHNDNI